MVREALSDITGTLADYSRALELDPGSSEAHAGFASTYMKMGQPDKAAAAGPQESAKKNGSN